MKKIIREDGQEEFLDDGTPGADVAAFATGRKPEEKAVLMTLAGAIGEGSEQVGSLMAICQEFAKEGEKRMDDLIEERAKKRPGRLR